MFKVKVLNSISKEGLNRFTDKYEIIEEDNIDAVLLRSYKMHDMDLPDTLKIVGRAGAGVNNIPIDKCSNSGIVVCNTPGANANAVKELVIAGLLLASRGVLNGISWANTIKDNENVTKLVEKEKSQFTGPELYGKKLGVIGLGAIGAMVANVAVSLGMEVWGYDPFISVEGAWGLSRKVKRAINLEQLVADSDYISVHVPVNEKTRNLLNKEIFEKAKQGIRVLNFARGELINDDDIIEAIDKGIVACYVTDFPNNKLVRQKNVICIPHLGASTPESQENCARMAVNQIKEYLENGNIINSVNYPNCNNGKCGTIARITINHKNIPNMVGQISMVLAEQQINISDMLNKSKGELAYTIMDVDSDVNANIIKSLKAIEGVLKVRVITI